MQPRQQQHQRVQQQHKALREANSSGGRGECPGCFTRFFGSGGFFVGSATSCFLVKLLVACSSAIAIGVMYCLQHVNSIVIC
jgi:hypothetical protein